MCMVLRILCIPTEGTREVDIPKKKILMPLTYVDESFALDSCLAENLTI